MSSATNAFQDLGYFCVDNPGVRGAWVIQVGTLYWCRVYSQEEDGQLRSTAGRAFGFDPRGSPKFKKRTDATGFVTFDRVPCGAIVITSSEFVLQNGKKWQLSRSLQCGESAVDLGIFSDSKGKQLLDGTRIRFESPPGPDELIKCDIPPRRLYKA